MLLQRVFNYCNILNQRFISRSVQNFDIKAAETIAKSSGGTFVDAQRISSSVIGTRMYVPTKFDKWLLTWVKKYPKGQVPEKIREEIIYQARSKARIKGSNYIIIFATIACLLAAYDAKKSARSGDSIEKRNKEWHRRINEEYAKERERAL